MTAIPKMEANEIRHVNVRDEINEMPLDKSLQSGVTGNTGLAPINQTSSDDDSAILAMRERSARLSENIKEACQACVDSVNALEALNGGKITRLMFNGQYLT